MCWFATSLRPIFHFPSPNLPLSYAQFVTSIFSIFQQDFSSNHISYLFPRPTACAQLATFFCLISLSLATLFFWIDWILHSIFFKLSNEFSQIIFRFCNTPGPRQLLAKLNTLRDVMYSTKLWTVTCAERRFPKTPALWRMLHSRDLINIIKEQLPKRGCRYSPQNPNSTVTRTMQGISHARKRLLRRGKKRLIVV